MAKEINFEGSVLKGVGGLQGEDSSWKELSLDTSLADTGSYCKYRKNADGTYSFKFKIITKMTINANTVTRLAYTEDDTLIALWKNSETTVGATMSDGTTVIGVQLRYYNSSTDAMHLAYYGAQLTSPKTFTGNFTIIVD